jgi:hypothetical protein
MTSKAIAGSSSSGKLSAEGIAAPETRSATALGTGDFFLAGMVGWGMSKSRVRKGESMTKLLTGQR